MHQHRREGRKNDAKIKEGSKEGKKGGRKEQLTEM